MSFLLRTQNWSAGWSPTLTSMTQMTLMVSSKWPSFLQTHNSILMFTHSIVNRYSKRTLLSTHCVFSIRLGVLYMWVNFIFMTALQPYQGSSFLYFKVQCFSEHIQSSEFNSECKNVAWVCVCSHMSRFVTLCIPEKDSCFYIRGASKLLVCF